MAGRAETAWSRANYSSESVWNASDERKLARSPDAPAAMVVRLKGGGSAPARRIDAGGAIQI
jgi:hypothetical protein